MFLRVIAILLGVIGAVGVGLTLVGLQHPAPSHEAAAAPLPPPEPKRLILVAARPQRAGNLMVAEDITTAEVQPGSEPAGCFIDSVAARTSLRGAMVRKSLAVNEPILRDDVLNPGDRGFLAAVLGVGMRAVTVAVDQVSGTAGLIWPGDRVDLVLTQQIDDRDLPAERRVFGETVLSNLRVIAVDQQLMEGAQGGPGGETPPGNVNRTVTIEAGLYDTQRIAVASRLGKISLVVRSAADDQQVSTDQPTAGAMAPVTPPPPIAWAGDVSPALRSHKSTGQSGRTIHLFHGPGTVDVMRY